MPSSYPLLFALIHHLLVHFAHWSLSSPDFLPSAQAKLLSESALWQLKLAALAGLYISCLAYISGRNWLREVICALVAFSSLTFIALSLNRHIAWDPWLIPITRFQQLCLAALCFSYAFS